MLGCRGIKDLCFFNKNEHAHNASIVKKDILKTEIKDLFSSDSGLFQMKIDLRITGK